MSVSTALIVGLSPSSIMVRLGDAVRLVAAGAAIAGAASSAISSTTATTTTRRLGPRNPPQRDLHHASSSFPASRRSKGIGSTQAKPLSVGAPSRPSLPSSLYCGYVSQCLQSVPAPRSDGRKRKRPGGLPSRLPARPHCALAVYFLTVSTLLRPVSLAANCALAAVVALNLYLPVLLILMLALYSVPETVALYVL